MSETSSEDISVSEIRTKLRAAPFYVQRLGLAAINLGYAKEFNYLIQNDFSPMQLYGAIIQELKQQDIPNPEEWLELFEIPFMYD